MKSYRFSLRLLNLRLAKKSFEILIDKSRGRYVEICLPSPNRSSGVIKFAQVGHPHEEFQADALQRIRDAEPPVLHLVITSPDSASLSSLDDSKRAADMESRFSL